MPLQSSGQLTLDEIHVEAGGTTSTEATINDTDIRDLISATADSEMEFADFYGADGSGGGGGGGGAGPQGGGDGGAGGVAGGGHVKTRLFYTSYAADE